MHSADITNAYFQGKALDRIVLMSQPRNGLPGVDPDALLLMRVRIYGLTDSGTGFSCSSTKTLERRDSEEVNSSPRCITCQDPLEMLWLYLPRMWMTSSTPTRKKAKLPLPNCFGDTTLAQLRRGASGTVGNSLPWTRLEPFQSTFVITPARFGLSLSIPKSDEVNQSLPRN